VKALVLAGGSGTRPRPATHASAKQLVLVANKPLLFHRLESLAEAGIVVGDGSKYGHTVTYIRQETPWRWRTRFSSPGITWATT
jgi:glucose-1-phosphate thymidylyltransferase